MSTLTEPLPIWSEAPRYAPDQKFPAYRFTPGFNAHPTGLPEGHSYGHVTDMKSLTPLLEENWNKNTTYLFGVDLYHQGYLWESHEAWENLWHLTEKTDVIGQLLQGLIQNSAALLKVHLKSWSAASHLSHEAWERLLFVLRNAPHETVCGLNLPSFLENMQAFYKPVWEKKENGLGIPPQINLSGYRS